VHTPDDCRLIAIVTPNLCTIIVFIRNRNLRKRSVYLVINLAVIDMFVGGAVLYYLFYRPGAACNLWKRHSFEDGTEVLVVILVFSSLTNIAIIALERVHATFFPFRHRVLKEMSIRINSCRCLGYIWVGNKSLYASPTV